MDFDWSDYSRLVASMYDQDREYWLSPVPCLEACAWCGGRYVHSRICCECAYDVQLKWPWNPFKGRPVRLVPADTLLRVLLLGIGDSGFRMRCFRVWTGVPYVTYFGTPLDARALPPGAAIAVLESDSVKVDLRNSEFATIG